MDILFPGILIFISFLVSASCGLGGSLILIPGLSWILGIKEGIVMSSLLLGLNNLVKLFFYRKEIRCRPSFQLLFLMLAGTALGALLMLKANSKLLSLFLFVHVLLSFLIQHKATETVKRKTGLLFSFLSGFCSGFTGTSGPLKGLAVKCFMNIKTEVVAAASILSLASDSLKSTIYLQNFSTDIVNLQWLGYSIIIMPLATWMGRSLNKKMSSRAYDTLFYFVMGGYVIRILL
jgi:uncharacterized membrane protein YfcA